MSSIPARLALALSVVTGLSAQNTPDWLLPGGLSTSTAEQPASPTTVANKSAYWNEVRMTRPRPWPVDLPSFASTGSPSSLGFSFSSHGASILILGISETSGRGAYITRGEAGGKFSARRYAVSSAARLRGVIWVAESRNHKHPLDGIHQRLELLRDHGIAIPRRHEATSRATSSSALSPRVTRPPLTIVLNWPAGLKR